MVLFKNEEFKHLQGFDYMLYFILNDHHSYFFVFYSKSLCELCSIEAIETMTPLPLCYYCLRICYPLIQYRKQKIVSSL